MAAPRRKYGNWLMVYADFITLMMIFFVVLYILTPGVEDERWEAVVGVFKGKDGQLDFQSVQRDIRPNVNISNSRTRAENWDDLSQRIQQEDLGDDIEMHLEEEGIRIILGEAALFETYSVELQENAKSILNDVAAGIDRYTAEDVELIDVQGHTDNRPVVGRALRKYETNWELGAGRAFSVMEYLSEKTNIANRKYGIRSFGEYRPKAPNISPENMKKNRRVEVLIQYKPHFEIHESELENLDARE
ncbi:MAG: OmpA family protein [Balneolales bacterium]